MVPLLVIFCCGVSTGDGGYRCKSSSMLYVGVVDIGLEMFAKWVGVEANVEIMVVRGPIGKYQFDTGCKTSLMGVRVRPKGPLGRVLVI